MGSILGGFGLHFGRFFGVKSEKVALESELKSKPKKKTLKSHATIPGKSWVTGWSGPKRFRSRRSRRGDPGEAIQERRSRRGDPGEDRKRGAHCPHETPSATSAVADPKI